MEQKLINRLYSDLNLYVLRQSGGKNKADKTLQKEYEERRQEKDTITSEIEMLVLERENKSAEIDTLTSNVSVKESKIAGVGGGYADIRGKLLTQKAVLEEKIRHQRKSIQEELGEDTPLYLMQSTMNRMKDQIEDDMSIAAQKMSTPMLNDIKNRLKEEIRSGKFWIEEKDRTQYSKKMLDMLDTTFEKPQNDAFFDIAPNEAVWMLQKIAKINEGCVPLLAKIEEYSKSTGRMEGVESDLIKIPKDDEIGPRISEINSMYQEIGVLRSEMAHIDQQISSKECISKNLKKQAQKDDRLDS